MKLNQILQGDCIEVMKTMEENSIDTIITDPPYGLSFMGKKWDYDVPSVEVWKEMLRIAKPGATLLTFAGTRTQHRIAINVEDAGWILKDCIMYLYGSGFPKATDISKQLDKRNGKPIRSVELEKYLSDSISKKYNKHYKLAEEMNVNESMIRHWTGKAGKQFIIPTKKQYNLLKKKLRLDNRFDELVEWEEAKREIIGKANYKTLNEAPMVGADCSQENRSFKDITQPQTPEAKLWNGWKSHGLKPAYEPILVAMKPNDKTYANNALKWGVSGLNIDGGRIEYKKEDAENRLKRDGKNKTRKEKHKGFLGYATKEETHTEISKGRFPANILLDEEAARMLDEQSGESKSGKYKGQGSKSGGIWQKSTGLPAGEEYGDKGGASRFFKVIK